MLQDIPVKRHKFICLVSDLRFGFGYEMQMI